MKTLVDRLSDKCIESQGPLDTPCWIWVGANDGKPYPYGRIRINGIQRPTHVVCYEIHYGDIPKDMRVCHKCDRGLCINPDHFFLGTDADNTMDMVKKGRHANREKHGRVLLNEDKIIEIKSLLDRRIAHSRIAELFNVSKSTISMISNGTNWR